MSADPTRALTLLAIGDVHLGRRPGHLPEDASAEELGPAAALRRAVDLALTEQVDAVLFAGDVVESSNARFEALRPLEREVRRLVEAGIPVLAVAGNHDVDALPRLADLVDGVTLLGRNGEWQGALVGDDVRGLVEILGWSFPTHQVRTSPVQSLLHAPPAPATGVRARLGLMHADLDATEGTYAPVRREELRQAGLDAWLLGHVHIPSLATGADGMLCGYLGSLVGLKPTETGAHGPWRIQVGADGAIHAEQVPLAPLWWEQRTLALAPDNDPDRVADTLAALAGEVAEEIQGRPHARPLALGLRVRLEGPTRHLQALRAWVQAGEWKDLERQVGDCTVFLDQVRNGFRVAHDLEELATGDDPPGLLARELLDLERGEEAAQALLAEARTDQEEVTGDPRWLAAGSSEEPSLHDVLHRAGMAALDALLSQRDGDQEAEA